MIYQTLLMIYQTMLLSIRYGMGWNVDLLSGLYVVIKAF